MKRSFGQGRRYGIGGVLVTIALILLPCLAPAAEPPLPTDPLAIRNELRALRKKSADNDKKVRARIDALMRQLQKLQGERDAAESQARGEERPEVDDDKAVMTREKMWKQTQTAEKGKEAEIDLAEPLREKIVKVYEEDRDPSVKNPDFFQQQTMLVLDLSRKESKLLIDQMENFRGITTLVVTGGMHGAPVNLPDILHKAKHLPLKELYIFNFKQYLTAVPESVGAFSNLETLSLFNNNLSKIPAAVAKMHGLKVLHIDLNPITTVLATLSKQFSLRELGIGKTKIPAEEQAKLARLLPECRIVTK
jgi:Skp family chaperone for outer membrane proteins